jgi:hypothetical protein
VLEYTINYRKKFFLYGKGIQPTIRLISARANVRILFPDFNPKEQSFSEAEPFTLEGRFVDVVKAVALLEQEALKYAEGMKERAAALEAKEREAKENRDKLRDAKEKEKDTTAKSKIAPTVILDRKSVPVSGPPANERGSGPDRTKPREIPTGKSAAKASSPEQEKKVKDIEKDVSNDQAKSVFKAMVSTTVTKDTAKPSFSTTNVTNNRTEQSTPPIAPMLSSKTSSQPNVASPISTGNSSKLVKDAEAFSAAEIAENPSVSIEKGAKFSRSIDIPYNIVGLLLSKKPRVKLSIMNQIQSSTRTLISKVIAAADTARSSLTIKEARHEIRRRRVDEDEDKSSDGSDFDKEDEESHIDDADVTNLAPTANISDADQPPVVFNIVGYSIDNVKGAYDYLERIIKGERIKEVVDSIPKRARNPKPEGLELPDQEKRATARERNEKPGTKPREPRSSRLPQSVTTENEEKGSAKNLTASESVEKLNERSVRGKVRSVPSTIPAPAAASAATTISDPVFPEDKKDKGSRRTKKSRAEVRSIPSSAAPPTTLSDSIFPVREKVKDSLRTENSRAEGLKAAAPVSGEEKKASDKIRATETSERGVRSRDSERPRDGELRGRGRGRENSSRDIEEGRGGRGGRDAREGRARGPPASEA